MAVQRRVRHADDMDTIFQTLGTGAAEFMLSPVVVIGTTVVWLLIATGVAGRVSLFLEDLRHPTPKAPQPTVPVRRSEHPAPRVAVAASGAR
jgi:hypothetical protein